MTARDRCIFRCSVLRQPCERRSPWLAGVVAEDQPASALAAGIHHTTLGRGCELPKHLGVEALVPRSEARIAEAPLKHAPVAAFTIRFHTIESTEGTSAVRLVPFDRRPWRCVGGTFAKVCICVPLVIEAW